MTAEADDSANLFDIIGDDVSMKHFCDDKYWLWEDTVARPALEARGYERITFHMGEHDSFGPLLRIVRAYKEGVCCRFFYG